MRKSKKTQLFYEYFEEWINLYKVDAVRPVTLDKYMMTLKWVRRLEPTLTLENLSRRSYQELLNGYAISHEKQTTLDFHHQVKGTVLDAVDEGIIKTNPTRKVIIKGRTPGKKKIKFLNEYDSQQLIKQMQLSDTINWDWFLLLILKTGLRFSEALALTPADFDFNKQILTIDKTWNYKNTHGSFQKTKNESSVRKVRIDWQLAMQFSQLIKNLKMNEPIFVDKNRIFNSTVNNHLRVLCEQAQVPVISVHGLRHTHASLLLFANVSIATVAQRLGHSSMTTTQETYLHIIKELEAKDSEKIMQQMAKLV
ncbi:hypothetical protein JC2156_07000 [Weissella koreensis KCTC 3621]|uniref:site-specific integrase n=1 Tax=Weissella koreensis TaxID=165096 RepID=UPI00026F1BA9|nr:site-specific integrase [Weissella koreensis]EJF33338.1 hypothetical protein JC2156_07000 [Weissella koreensis KCTC 3621]